MMCNDGVLLSVLILSIQFDLVFVFCISPVDDHVAGASFTILSGLIVWLGSCLSVYEGFVMGYSCCWVWGVVIACQLFLGSNFVVLSFKMSDLLVNNVMKLSAFPLAHACSGITLMMESLFVGKLSKFFGVKRRSIVTF